MSTAELELRRSLGDVLDDELNRMPDHWNATSHSNRSLEDLLILPAQEHHQDYQLSSPIFKHFTTNNNNNNINNNINSSNIPSNISTFAGGNHHSILQSSMINNTPMIDDTHSGYTAVAEGISTANIFSKYADPSLTTTHVNSNQEQSHQRDSHHSLQASQQQGHQNVLQHQHQYKRVQRATDTPQLNHGTKPQQKQYLTNQTQNLIQKRTQHAQQQSRQQSLQQTQSKQQQYLTQSPVTAQNRNSQVASNHLPCQSPQAQQLLQQCTTSGRLPSNAGTPTQPTISLNNVMCSNNPFIPRFASTCASSIATNPLSTVAGATIACNQISLSKYNLIDDHQTRIADQQELELMDNDDYIRDYYLEENGHKMNYLWPLQENFNNSQSHFHDPMQQLFDQDFDDDLSDEDDDSNSFELLGDDYEGIRTQDDESQFFGCRKASVNSSVISTARQLLNTDTYVGNGMAVDGFGTCKNIDNGNLVDDMEGDNDEDDEDDEEEDNDSSSVFDDDDLFESKGARKPSMVVSSKKLSKASKSFKNMALTPSSPSSSNDTAIPSASNTSTAVNSDTSAVLISVPIHTKKGIKGSIRSENVDASPPATNSSSSTAKSKKRVATNRRKSSGAGMIPHLAKKSSPPTSSNVAVSAPSHSLSGVVASTATSHIPASDVAAAKDSLHAKASAAISATQHNQLTHHQHSCSNDPNEEHTCLLINSITKLPCLKKFSRPYDLIRHQKTIHASKKKIFRCLICIQEHGTEGYQRTFSRGDALSRHVKVKHELVGEEAQKVIQFAKENVEYVEA